MLVFLVRIPVSFVARQIFELVHILRDELRVVFISDDDCGGFVVVPDELIDYLARVVAHGVLPAVRAFHVASADRHDGLDRALDDGYDIGGCDAVDLTRYPMFPDTPRGVVALPLVGVEIDFKSLISQLCGGTGHGRTVFVVDGDLVRLDVIFIPVVRFAAAERGSHAPAVSVLDDLEAGDLYARHVG